MAKKVQDELIRTTRSQRERFEYALDQVVGKTHIRDGIGTLSEKTVHAVLKYYYEPDSSHHAFFVICAMKFILPSQPAVRTWHQSLSACL